MTVLAERVAVRASHAGSAPLMPHTVSRKKGSQVLTIVLWRRVELEAIFSLFIYSRAPSINNVYTYTHTCVNIYVHIYVYTQTHVFVFSEKQYFLKKITLLSLDTMRPSE